MGRNRSRLYLFVLVFFAIISLLFFVWNKKTHQNKFLKINFLSDHAISKEAQGSLSETLSVFCDVFYMDGSVGDYFGKVSFTRLDLISKNIDEIKIEEISEKSKSEEAQQIYQSARSGLQATPSMWAESNSLTDTAYLNGLISGTRYFYLVNSLDSSMVSSIYFDNYNTLLKYIREGLKKGDFFEGKSNSVINIVLSSGNGNASSIINCPDCNGKKVIPDANGNCPVCPPPVTQGVDTIDTPPPPHPPKGPTQVSTETDNPKTTKFTPQEVSVDLDVDWSNGMVSWNPELARISTKLVLVVSFPDLETGQDRFEKIVTGSSCCFIDVEQDYSWMRTTISLQPNLSGKYKLLNYGNPVSNKNGIAECADVGSCSTSKLIVK
jgi:hypothetical protein